MQDVGGSACLRKDFSGDDGADPQVDLLKILPRNDFHAALPDMTAHWVKSLPIAMITRTQRRAYAGSGNQQSMTKSADIFDERARLSLLVKTERVVKRIWH